jgi:hypothetical protein
MEALNLTPKTFITAFLTKSTDDCAFRRRFWGTERGWDSTKNLLNSIHTLVSTQDGGQGYWEQWILSHVGLLHKSLSIRHLQLLTGWDDQATALVCKEKPRSGNYPHGAYVSSRDLRQSFFTKEEHDLQNRFIEESMPFLYQLLCTKLQSDRPRRPDIQPSSPDAHDDN